MSRYEERAQSFWASVEGKGYSNFVIVVGLALLELWRRRDCPACCSISNIEVATLIGSNEKTVRRACTELVGLGLCWRQSKRGSLPTYFFDESAVPPELKERPEVKKEKPKVKKPKKVLTGEPSLFSEKAIKAVDKDYESRNGRRKKEFQPPDLQTCIGEFLRQGGTEEDARSFYSYYDSQDWYKANGKNKISRLETAVMNWLMIKRNERRKDNRPGGRLASQEDKLKAELLARYGKI